MIIPDKKLIGQNVKFTNETYTDDYIKALNQYAPIEEVFGQHQKRIFEGDFDTIAKVVMGTLGKGEYEYQLASMMVNAARAGEWVALERKQMHGLDMIVEKNYGHIAKEENKVFLLPSVSYALICKDKLNN